MWDVLEDCQIGKVNMHQQDEKVRPDSSGSAVSYGNHIRVFASATTQQIITIKVNCTLKPSTTLFAFIG
jgi:hypothetical protein